MQIYANKMTMGKAIYQFGRATQKENGNERKKSFFRVPRENWRKN
jgi:hypothetical protein